MSVSLFCPHCQSLIEPVTGDSTPVACPSCGGSLAASHAATADWSSTERKSLGKFTLLHALGAGSYGTVYKARDTELGRIVAIKAPHVNALGRGTDSTTRFLREARSTAQLRHPSIVPVFEVGLDSGLPFIVSEFVSGITLADLLTSERLTFQAAAQLTAELADALEYAHQQGVVHRDVKPANIMLERSSPQGGSENSSHKRYLPRLMDFGLARSDSAESTVTLAGEVIGTPAYMSPEQARGESHEVDGRSDVYSLGVIFYQLLTGELPFKGNARMLLHHVLHDEPISPRRRNPKTPRDLETICLKAMAKEVDKRYESAGELAADLRRYLADRPIVARPAGAAERLWRWQRRNRLVLGLSAALFLSLGALLGYAVIAESQRRMSERKSNETKPPAPVRDELAEVVDRLDRDDPQWRLEQIDAQRAKIPDDENGALIVKRLSADLRKLRWPAEDQSEFINSLSQSSPLQALSPSDRTRLQQILDSAGLIREQARELSRFPRGRFDVTYSRSGIVTVIEHLPQTRYVSNLLYCDALQRCDAGDTAGGIQSLQAEIHVAGVIGDEPGLIAQLVRGAILDRALDALERLLARQVYRDEELRAIQSSLEEIAKVPMPYIGTRGERGNEHWQMTAIHAGDLDPSVFFQSSKLDQQKLLSDLPRGQAFRPIHAWYLAHASKLVEISRVEAPELKTRLDWWAAEINRESRIPVAIAPYFEHVTNARRQALETMTRQTARLRCAIALIASERYRLQNLRWPSNLETVVPAFLQNVPRDPFTAAPLLLKPASEGITIYSVGKDEVDNQGAVDSQTANDVPLDLGLRLWNVELRAVSAP